MEEDSLYYCTSKEATPVMMQYFQIKEQHKDCLLFFRMGDFYELFFDDAKIAAAILNIALTQRGKYDNKDIPMCGIPFHAMDNYVGKLVGYGYKIAICEQLEEPADAKKLRGYKAVIKRDVTRILTPGTILDDFLFNNSCNNFLMSVVPEYSKKNNALNVISFAVIDISTNDFYANMLEINDFISICEHYMPKEILVPYSFEKSDILKKIKSISNALITPLPDSKFNAVMEKERIEKYFKVKTLDSFNITSAGEIAACGAIIEYLLITQKGNFASLPIPKKENYSNYLIIDASTSKSLEIVSSQSGQYKQSLLGCLDDMRTPYGLRLLSSVISMPCINLDDIEKRLDCVEYFIKESELCAKIRSVLANASDVERAINRIKFKKTSPKDLGDIREFLRILTLLKVMFEKYNGYKSEKGYNIFDVYDFSVLLKYLDTALLDKLPFSLKDGGIIADGFSKELDEVKYLKNHSEELIVKLQNKYIEETSISTLKIKNNAIMGWYIEVPLTQKSKMSNDKYIHRQTLVNSVRYITEELIDFQEQQKIAFEKWFTLEQHILQQIINEVLRHEEHLIYAIKTLSFLDLHTNFATISTINNYVRPLVSNEVVLDIEDGRHPVISNLNKDFVENDCKLVDDKRFCIITGPNMAGKSTYLRQNALIIIMAQIGCFVSAKTAHVGIVDKIFSRIGASDDIAKGRSTFMVEMIETATILNQATEKSFIILDEVGRGTSTYDGLAIAWAVIEHLHNSNKSRVLFATHYRELSVLENMLKRVMCKTLKVQEWNGDVVFYHKIIDGVADKSYGIHVASIAGVPKCVINRAKVILKDIEKQNHNAQLDFSSGSSLDDALRDDGNIPKNYFMSDIEKAVKDLDIDNISPKTALEFLYELKKMIFYFIICCI